MDAALAPLRLQGIHAMNYTVQAVGLQSLGLHSITTLGPGPQIDLPEKCPHCESEDGLSGNATGLCTMQERLSPGCVLLVCACLSLFRCGESVSVDLCRRLLSHFFSSFGGVASHEDNSVVDEVHKYSSFVVCPPESNSLQLPSGSHHLVSPSISCTRCEHKQCLLSLFYHDRCIPDQSSRAVRSLGSGPAGVSLST